MFPHSTSDFFRIRSRRWIELSAGPILQILPSRTILGCVNHGRASTGTQQRPAAFFDLDKTVIARSSTLAFSKPFFEEGLINRRAVLKSSYAQFLFLLSGADHEQTDRLRSHITTMCEGWDVAQVESIVQETLHDIVTPYVFAEAAALISDHIARGHDVVVVSASGTEIVKPIAEALGAKHALASRMAVRDGRYTGELEFFCHGPGKAQAIRELAEQEGYDLRVSHAYSNSASDLPMLETVGHPAAVNPDRQLRREAAAQGWPVLTFSDPISLRAQLPAPSTKAVATTAAIGLSAVVAAGAAAFSYFRRRN
ncbi:HAD-IB family hydrolase [Hoyosella subflava]|uniref:HAD-superfamily protein subfamily protein IB hydrolase n=1 Tax=Hoyosella subflava (strain DSM 45089 / JCM 17490 / NBRC 109087 / DQS3-9A1) TaxID=443218 RepID=F6EG34_HOYSD|nr:HAD-superfamily protein subfamily protein IB hydrolase [Hoyosella subflava DQS3-9A1]